MNQRRRTLEVCLGATAMLLAGPANAQTRHVTPAPPKAPPALQHAPKASSERFRARSHKSPTTPVPLTPLDPREHFVHLLNRCSFGTRPGDLVVDLSSI